MKWDNLAIEKCNLTRTRNAMACYLSTFSEDRTFKTGCVPETNSNMEFRVCKTSSCANRSNSTYIDFPRTFSSGENTCCCRSQMCNDKAFLERVVLGGYSPGPSNWNWVYDLLGVLRAVCYGLVTGCIYILVTASSTEKTNVLSFEQGFDEEDDRRDLLASDPIDDKAASASVKIRKKGRRRKRRDDINRKIEETQVMSKEIQTPVMNKTPLGTPVSPLGQSIPKLMRTVFDDSPIQVQRTQSSKSEPMIRKEPATDKKNAQRRHKKGGNRTRETKESISVGSSAHDIK